MTGCPTSRSTGTTTSLASSCHRPGGCCAGRARHHHARCLRRVGRRGPHPRRVPRADARRRLRRAGDRRTGSVGRNESAGRVLGDGGAGRGGRAVRLAGGAPHQRRRRQVAEAARAGASASSRSIFYFAIDQLGADAAGAVRALQDDAGLRPSATAWLIDRGLEDPRTLAPTDVPALMVDQLAAALAGGGPDGLVEVLAGLGPPASRSRRSRQSGGSRRRRWTTCSRRSAATTTRRSSPRRLARPSSNARAPISPELAPPCGEPTPAELVRRRRPGCRAGR